MPTYVKKDDPAYQSKRLTREEWAQIWFNKLAQFHKIESPQGWCFSREQVIKYLQFRRDHGVPAKKRRMIVPGLITFQNQFRDSASRVDLSDIRAKLGQIAA